MAVEVRAQVWAKTDGRCWYCGKLMNPWNDFTVEHMDPRSQGGCDDLANLVPACQSCNSRKHAKTVEEYRMYIHEKQIVKFWGEHDVKRSHQPPEPEEIIDEEPKGYLDHFEGYIYACMRIAKIYGSGCAMTALRLLLDALQNYQEGEDEDTAGDWCLELKDIALCTNQPHHHVLSHLMMLANLGIITIDWSTSYPTYVFYFDRLWVKITK